MNQARRRLRIRQRFMLYACAAMWLTALIISHIPVEKMPETYAPDVGLHFIGFFVLAEAEHLEKVRASERVVEAGADAVVG